jgi:hypothetical protein
MPPYLKESMMLNFIGEVTVALLNQLEDKNHHTGTLHVLVASHGVSLNSSLILH